MASPGAPAPPGPAGELLKALDQPFMFTKSALDALIETSFVNSVDAPSLALIMPIDQRGMKDAKSVVKRSTSQVVGGMCSFIKDVKIMSPCAPEAAEAL